MDMQFFDNAHHDPKPRQDMQITRLDAAPYPDGVRVLVNVDVTPFRERPNLILAIRDATGRVVSDLSIIETMYPAMEFRMHLRGLDDTTGDYTLTADLFYETRNPPQDQRVVAFSIAPMSDVDLS